MIKRYEMVEKCPSHRGKNELLNHLSGKRITLKQAILAKCYECMGYYVDGAVDCTIPSCPLYSTMPYGKERQKSRPPMTPENKAKAVARFKEAREKKKAAKK